jgi:hypothetical protein
MSVSSRRNHFKSWVGIDLGVCRALEVMRFSLREMAVAMAISVALVLFSASGAVATTSRPDPSDSPAMARWLVSQSDWGVLRYAQSLSIPWKSSKLWYSTQRLPVIVQILHKFLITENLIISSPARI